MQNQREPIHFFLEDTFLDGWRHPSPPDAMRLSARRWIRGRKIQSFKIESNLACAHILMIQSHTEYRANTTFQSMINAKLSHQRF